MSEALWTKADGTVIPIRLMSDRHLENTILMLRRRGYISMAEVGPIPPNDALQSDRMAWATRIGSPFLDQLGEERLRRLDEGEGPFGDDEAEIAQARWAASIRVGQPYPARAPYPPRHSLSPYHGRYSPHDPPPWEDGPYGSQEP